MPRVRPRLKAFLILTCLFTSLLVVGAEGAASGLPTRNGPVGKVVKKVDRDAGQVVKKVDGGIDRVLGGADQVIHRAAGVVVGAVAQVSRAAEQGISKVVKAASQAAPAPISPGGTDEGGAPVSQDDGRAGRIRESAPPRTAVDEGDVDELAQGGNEILPEGQGNQQGVGNFQPLAPGGENRPLGFTGLNLLMAMALAMALAGAGTLLTAADRRRLALAVPG
jgi:hypothetical protein